MGAGRDQHLDGLRALAITAVFFFHTSERLPGGFVGVDVFFVLSGFLITRILISEADATGNIDLRKFFIRRARRLAPALAVFLTACVIFHRWLWGPGWFQMLTDVSVAALYLTDIVQAVSPYDSAVQHTWSLGIETQFYFIWPIVILKLARVNRRKAFSILLASWLCVTLAHDIAIFCGLMKSSYFSPLHCGGLILGSATAFARKSPVPGWLAFIIMEIYLFIPRTTVSDLAIIPMAELLSAAIILSPPRILAIKPLPWIGSISYGVYLWHAIIWRIVAWHFHLPLSPQITLLLTLIVSATSYYLLERPILRMATRTKTPGLLEQHMCSIAH